ncbi:universal stress protein [Haloarcula nitratireducens]|uniref:Universal stress protein n=1 Tax=Haloarcula nitratireducens TaxID=2487749 RepID=A0AAW4PG71_9EURY|nr:universal stress protein [Halomicroarcula nitratireducens]MBX0296300.1 universal stress protein [Halomicroarcula nitratireducens]
MTIFVPYDGTTVSSAALERAQSLAYSLDEALVVSTVVPRDRENALDHQWITADETFDAKAIVSRFEARVASLAPTAEFHPIVLAGRAQSGSIARRLRDVARENGATLVVVGSDNIGRFVRPVNTVGGRVAARLDTDLYVVQETEAEYPPIATG